MKHSTLNIIMKATCGYFKITPLELFNRSRQRHIVEKRMIFYYLASKLTNESLEKIGLFSKVHSSHVWGHCSVLHSRNTIKNLLEFDKDVQSQVRAIESLARMTDVKKDFDLPDIKQNVVRLAIDSVSVKELKSTVQRYLEVI